MLYDYYESEYHSQVSESVPLRIFAPNPEVKNPSVSLKMISDLTKEGEGEFEIINNGNVLLDGVRFQGPFDFHPSSSLSFLWPGESIKGKVELEQDNLDFEGKKIFPLIIEDNDRSIKEILNFSLIQGNLFCKQGEAGGNLELRDLDINNPNSYKDNYLWKHFDSIEMSVVVRNTGDNEVNGIIVEMGLFDQDGKNQEDELDYERNYKGVQNIGTLQSGESKEVEFRFTVSDNLEEEEYKLAIKAYSDDLGEEFECTRQISDRSKRFSPYFQEIEIDEGWKEISENRKREVNKNEDLEYNLPSSINETNSLKFQKTEEKNKSGEVIYLTNKHQLTNNKSFFQTIWDGIISFFSQ